MTQEEKAKAYDEAVRKAKDIIEYYKTHDREYEASIEDLGTIFPELKESEDEKIRKGIKSILEYYKESGEVVCPYLFVSIDEALAWLDKQCEPADKGEISDGYHTFNELYYYRMLYNAAFFNMLPKDWVHKSKKHNDGEECFGGGWFIVMANLPTGQISNHYELKDWDLFQIPEKEVADKWDGHTPQEAADRLHKYLLEKHKESVNMQHSQCSTELEDAVRYVINVLKHCDCDEEDIQGMGEWHTTIEHIIEVLEKHIIL